MRPFVVHSVFFSITGQVIVKWTVLAYDTAYHLVDGPIATGFPILWVHYSLRLFKRNSRCARATLWSNLSLFIVYSSLKDGVLQLTMLKQIMPVYSMSGVYCDRRLNATSPCLPWNFVIQFWRRQACENNETGIIAARHPKSYHYGLCLVAFFGKPLQVFQPSAARNACRFESLLTTFCNKSQEAYSVISSNFSARNRLQQLILLKVRVGSRPH